MQALNLNTAILGVGETPVTDAVWIHTAYIGEDSSSLVPDIFG